MSRHVIAWSRSSLPQRFSSLTSEKQRKQANPKPKHGSSEVEQRIATPEIPGSNPTISRSQENLLLR